MNFLSQGPRCPRSENRLGGVGTLCEAEDKRHRLSEPVFVLWASFDAARGEQLEFQPTRR